ncbi:MAG: multidrug efflux RND transporter permease subunit [Alphaproteobacteria bacterium]|nr:multidrug efflux RND transporter permease subunit [Alphaproteobacteria bacterium]
MAKFFIEWPILANVLAIVIMLIGVVALIGLPISQYPEIVPPTVQVQTSYPGANAQTVVNTVALPIEQQVNGVEDMIYMQSTSANDGTYNLIITFAVGTNLDIAQVQVQNRVSAAMAQLPMAVQQQGVTTQKKSTAMLQIITLTSENDQYSSLFLSNYATISLVNELARLPGVGNVTVFGIGQYSMRIWLDPEQLYARSMTPTDVMDAIRAQNQEVAAGQVGMPPAPIGQSFQLTVNVPGRLDDPSQFADIIVKSENASGGRITRIRDIGRVELGAQTYSQFCKFDGRPSAGIAIFQLPGANALDVAKEVDKAMKKMSKNFPQGLQYSVPFDTTKFVVASINEVYTTLFEAGILVLIVIMVFLQNFRAMLVPATTVPVTIIGAFAAMAALGFSINLMTLFAIVLSIGIVVDDAIVVVEGASQHIERGVAPKQAAINAMAELMGPIIGITLVLMSVFLPAAMLPGIVGQLYRQFALVIAATALISAINAATLKPTQCALWLRPPKPGKKNIFFRAFDRAYLPVEHAYVRLIDRMVHRSGLMVAIAAVLVALSFWGLTTIPTGFIPPEDQGYVIVSVQLPDAASLERTEAVMQKVNEIAKGTPGVDHVVTIGGISVLDNNASLANGAVAYVILKDWGVRGKGEDLRSIYFNLQGQMSQIQEARALVLIPPPIQGLGQSGGFQMQLELTDGTFDFVKLQQAADAMVANGGAQSSLQHLMTPFRASVPQIKADVDRVKAETLKVPIKNLFDTLQTYLGSTYVNQITKFGRTFPVFVQADHQYRLTPEDLRRLYVRNEFGDTVPIGTLTDVRYTQGPALISLYNLYPTAAINGMAGEGFSSGQALAVMEQVAARTLPAGVDYEWTSISYQEKLVGNQVFLVFGLAIALVFLVLAGQYESWSAPAAVIFAVPLALLGTVIALKGLGIANNVYTQIGLVLLIALASKNAILIVEVAREKRLKEGKSIVESAVEAAKIRFRPIVMTSFAFILGVVPLVLASGAGAAARKSIGIAVFSGMLASTCLAVLFVPSFFVVLERLSERRKKPEAPAHHAPPAPAAPPAE